MTASNRRHRRRGGSACTHGFKRKKELWVKASLDQADVGLALDRA